MLFVFLSSTVYLFLSKLSGSSKIGALPVFHWEVAGRNHTFDAPCFFGRTTKAGKLGRALAQMWSQPPSAK